MADAYLAYHREHAPRSYQFRASALVYLRPAFEGKAVNRITPADVAQYLERRRAEGAAPGTVNRERFVLGHLFTWAKVPGPNPVRETKKLREPDGVPRPIAPEEEARLFACLPAGKRVWLHWREVVTLALNTGLRLSELRYQALARGELAVTRLKSRKPETVPLNAPARAVLASLDPKAPVLFPGMPRKLSDLFVRYAKRAGFEDVTFHCLRDTFISRVGAVPGMSVPLLMEAARHRDYRTTRRYLWLDRERLRAAVEGIVPVLPVRDSVEISVEAPRGRAPPRMPPRRARKPGVERPAPGPCSRPAPPRPPISGAPDTGQLVPL